MSSIKAAFRFPCFSTQSATLPVTAGTRDNQNLGSPLCVSINIAEDKSDTLAPHKNDICECSPAMHRRMAWAAGEGRPVIDEQQANPTIGKAINGGYDLLETKCNRCRRVSLVQWRALKRPADTPILKLEAALFCEPCSDNRPRAPPPAPPISSG
jgi:hypothetical protein